MAELVVMDWISVTKDKFVLVIEAGRSSLGEATKQCLLSMKDAWDNNSEGIIYGFITTGEHWQMFRYDGTSFQKTRNIIAVFDGMDGDKKPWMKDCSVLVDCLIAALNVEARLQVSMGFSTEMFMKSNLLCREYYSYQTTWRLSMMYSRRMSSQTLHGSRTGEPRDGPSERPGSPYRRGRNVCSETYVKFDLVDVVRGRQVLQTHFGRVRVFSTTATRCHRTGSERQRLRASSPRPSTRS